jgi:hypothetical protein
MAWRIEQYIGCHILVKALVRIGEDNLKAAIINNPDFAESFARLKFWSGSGIDIPVHRVVIIPETNILYTERMSIRPLQFLPEMKSPDSTIWGNIIISTQMGHCVDAILVPP